MDGNRLFAEDIEMQLDKARNLHIWRWAPGVILFPEALCPKCNGAMRSTRIWQVDERAQRLLGAVYFDDGKIVRVMGQIHPNVEGSMGGPVCLGDASSTSEALFLGIGHGRPYWSPNPSWYKEAFDHECTPSSRRNSRQHLTESMKLASEKDTAAKRAEMLAKLKALRPAAAEPSLFTGEAIATPGTADGGLHIDRL